MRRAKKIMTVTVSILFPLLLFLALQRLVEPKYDGQEDMPLEGNFTAEYYEETTAHDVIMVGDCEVYENVDTMALWKNYGITSYIRGNAQQLAWQSYYLLEDTLQYEKPEVVIYNVQALEHEKPQRESYNRMTLDGMKWSRIKWEAIRASMCPEENMLDYIFPLLRYHSRITSLTKNDLKYYREPKKVSHNGYYMRIDVLPASESDLADTEWLLGEEAEADNEMEDGSGSEDDSGTDLWDMMEEEDTSGEEDMPEEPDEDLWDMMEEEDGAVEAGDASEESGTDETSEDRKITFGKYPMHYLDKMRRLCRENGIQLILMKAPSLSPVWYDSEEQQVLDYAEKYDLPYINFYDLLEETGIDYETDSYDGGLHLNLAGAGKISEYLGRVLTEEYGVEDHRKEAGISQVYEQKYRFYEDMIEAQQEELERYGEIRSY